MDMKCGNCKGDHAKVSEVKDCYAYSQHDEEEAQAEAAMEARAERFWEEGPHGPTPEDPREVEAQMRDDMRREAAEAQYNRDVQAREAEEDEAAYTAKLKRDEELEAASKLDQMTGTTGNPDPPSDKQVRYALDLLDSKKWPDRITEEDLRGMRRRQVSGLISNLKTAPAKPDVKVPVPELSAGMYRLADGKIVRAYLGQRSGRLLAKQLVFVGVRESSEKDIAKGLPETWEEWRYEYMGAAEKNISGDFRKLSVEEARQWGATTRSCCRCARRLDVPESVDAGIGPVCAGKDDWA